MLEPTTIDSRVRQMRKDAMALKKLPYEKVGPLLKDYLSTEEDVETAALIRDLRKARVRRYLTQGELEKVCRWKSARSIRLIKGNSAARIRTATARALVTRSERRRLEELTSLSGVSIPMASAILMLLNPQRYGVIDIRVWQLLHAVGAVTKKSSGVGFNFNNWYQFLMIIRHFAKKLRVRARDIERSLFLAHQAYQTGTLYRTAGSPTVHLPLASPAPEILDYLARHPDAQDTIEGVLHWWLGEAGVRKSSRTLTETITQLVECGLMEQERTADGRIFYRASSRLPSQRGAASRANPKYKNASAS